MNMRHLLLGCAALLLLTLPAFAQAPATCSAPRTAVACLYLPLLQQSAATPTPAPTQQPAAAVLVRNTRVFQQGNTSYVVGEAENITNAPVYQVGIRVLVYDADDVLVGSTNTTTGLVAIFPGQRVAFRTLFNNTAAATHADATVIAAARSSVLAYVPVAVETQQFSPATFGMQVAGTLRNPNAAVVGTPLVLVTFYDATGLVVEAASGYAGGGSMAAGQATSYAVSVAANVAYDHYLVQAQSYIVPRP